VTSSVRTFHWRELERALGPLADAGLAPDDKGRALVGAGVRVLPPAVAPLPAGCASLADYVAGAPRRLGHHLVVLMQAGATSLGWFEDGEEVATKSLRRYVVRGSGRAQPTHRDRKGKSRYGSRLRLQNAKRLVEETNAKLREWVERYGPPERIFYSAPVRLWPTLFEGEVTPPFERDAPLTKIPRDLPKPTTDVLRRAYRSLCYGRVEEEEGLGPGR